MKIDEQNERNERYIRDAKQKLAGLGEEIERLNTERAEKPDNPMADAEASLEDIQRRVSELAQELEDLARVGEQQWSDLQANVESGLWDLRAVLQRVVDRTRPLANFGADGTKSRYFLQKAPNGRWGLQRQGARASVKYFTDKSEALHFSRRYVRQKSPAELVVRRLDGTFEAVHNYH